jgi:hypothetical protein
MYCVRDEIWVSKEKHLSEYCRKLRYKDTHEANQKVRKDLMKIDLCFCSASSISPSNFFAIIIWFSFSSDWALNSQYHCVIWSEKTDQAYILEFSCYLRLLFPNTSRRMFLLAVMLPPTMSRYFLGSTITPEDSNYFPLFQLWFSLNWIMWAKSSPPFIPSGFSW